MIKNFRFIAKNLNQKKIILLFCFTVTILSISSSFQHLRIFSYNSEISIFQVFNFLRISFNLVCFLILTIMCLKFIEIKKINFLFILFFLFFLAQIPGTVYIQKNYENLLLIISALNIIFILILANEEFYLKDLKIFLYILFLLLTVVLFVNFTVDLITYFADNLRFYGRVNYYFDAISIRSSGSSRISLILLIIYSCMIFNHIKLRWLKYLPILIFATIIFLYQSRASILLLFIFLIVDTIHMKKPIFLSLLFCILIPKIIVSTLPIAHSVINFDKNNFNYKDLLEKSSSDRNKLERKSNGGQFSSGRKEDWLEIYNSFNIKKNLYFGYGSQGDRYLINQTASNGPIYAFVSSGLIGLLLYTFLSLYLLMLIYKYYFVYNRTNNLIHCCSIIILLIMIRSLVESSYAHFGIDYILIALSSCILIKNEKLYK